MAQGRWWGLGTLALAWSFVPPASAALRQPELLAATGDDAPGGLVLEHDLRGRYARDGKLAMLVAATGAHDILVHGDEILFDTYYQSGVISYTADLAWDWVVGTSGAFLIRPALSGDYTPMNAIYGPDGRLLGAGDPVPGLTEGVVSEVIHLDIATDGSVSMQIEEVGYHDLLLRADDVELSNPTIVLQEDDVVDGWTISSLFRHRFSDDAGHLAVVASDFPTTILIIDDAVVAHEDETIPGGGEYAWDSFGNVDINNVGQFAVGGRATDYTRVIAVDGQLVLDEYDTLDGVQLNGDRTPVVALNNAGGMLHTWADSAIFSCDASDPASTSRVLLVEGDDIDVTGDAIADAVVREVDEGQLMDDGRVLVNARVNGRDVGGDVVLQFSVSCCGNGFIEADEECDGAIDCNEDCEFEPHTDPTTSETGGDGTSGTDGDPVDTESTTADPSDADETDGSQDSTGATEIPDATTEGDTDDAGGAASSASAGCGCTTHHRAGATLPLALALLVLGLSGRGRIAPKRGGRPCSRRPLRRSRGGSGLRYG